METGVAPEREALVRERVSAVLSEYGLSGIGKAAAMAYLRQLSKPEMERVRSWWLRRLNGRELEAPEGSHPGQVGCPEIFAGLRSSPFWRDGTSWLRRVEASAATVRKELLSLRDERFGFQPYRSPSGKSTDAGAWNVYYLDLHSCDVEANRRRCPATVDLLDAVPRKYGHAFFSATAPKTHITPHHGPTNKKLRCQLPLVCPSGGSCRLRVHDETVDLREGEALLFDDSFQHEAWNDHPDQSRIVLVFDVWHPDLSDKEIKFLNFLQTAALRKQRRLVAEKNQTQNNFTSKDDHQDDEAPCPRGKGKSNGKKKHHRAKEEEEEEEDSSSDDDLADESDDDHETHGAEKENADDDDAPVASAALTRQTTKKNPPPPNFFTLIHDGMRAGVDDPAEVWAGVT
eukprot:CAMPEP_0118900900 /NCGR_PEP_ID=MMETSP1166-20130328/6824_1 /TAXON_ID=1104430 /ORGANISM="Chrysoreinhardia sp, Strain CCMP3193" /LENGTH=400 /DNA_ID=CAMNT_0006840055 /DNA_START=39 /DNA_END=1237 /DNA_ORIENTATION=+